MKVVLIAGGTVDEGFCLEWLKENTCDKIIGIDRGLEFLHKCKIRPDLIVGDFDSLTEGILEEYQGNVPIRRFIPEKDATDMEIGIREAVNMGADSITIFGGTGTRLDHFMGNVQSLSIPMEQGIEAYILDSHNRICLIKDNKTIRKEDFFGDYVSFFPLTTTVEGLALKGFKYPLDNAMLTSHNSLGVSNEVTEEEAVVQLKKGILIMMESRD